MCLRGEIPSHRLGVGDVSVCEVTNETSGDFCELGRTAKAENAGELQGEGGWHSSASPSWSKKTFPRALPEQSEGQHQSLLMSILSQAPQQELWGSPHHGPCSEMRINYPAVPRECQRINQNTSGVEPGLRLWGHSGNYRCMGLVTAESCWVSEV